MKKEKVLQQGLNTMAQENSGDDGMDSQDTLSGESVTSTGTSGTFIPDSGSHKRVSSQDGKKESKKARKDRLANTELMQIVRDAAVVESAVSVSELVELRSLVATLAADNARVEEEITSLKNQPLLSSKDSGSTSAYGFFDSVVFLANAADVMKAKILAIIAQHRNPLF
jgi:hypothetical protein